jgi:glycosyltransferase involved in cell wall biosynthesis
MGNKDAGGDVRAIVYSLNTGAERLLNLGSYGYSYDLLKARFRPTLEQCAVVTEIAQPESRLEFAIHAAAQTGGQPVAMGFAPFQNIHPTRSAAHVVYMCWEFPDVPQRAINGDRRFEWPRMSRHTSLIIVPATFVRDSLERGGVRTPIRVIPVPMPPEQFEIPPWEGGSAVAMGFRGHDLAEPGSGTPRAAGRSPRPAGTWALVRREATRALRKLRGRRWQPAACIAPEPELTGTSLDLRGVVYTMIFNLADARKAWEEALTAFVHALRDHEDATLVLKLSVTPQLAPTHLDAVRAAYARLASIPHRCRVVVVTQSLDDAQMQALTRATTYYANITRAEGAGLPIQEAMAAGRPALSPLHTSMTDYFDASVGFVVRSSPEPTSWPGDATQQYSTSWARLDWHSLHDQFQASYRLAQDRAAYDRLSLAARERMRTYADPAAITEQMRRALNEAVALSAGTGGSHYRLTG